MQRFRALGDEIERRWRAAEYDESVFPAIAAGELEEAGLHRSVGLKEVADWILAAPRLPSAAVSRDFSDAGFCVYHHPRFVVQMLTWLEASTAIHQHSFCGAFQVLDGSSLQTTYAFECEERLSERLLFGSLERLDIRQLAKGAVEEIAPGSTFLHRLFHLDRPSLTLVVRTPVQSVALQYAYLEPGIAYDAFRRTDDLNQKLKMLGVVRRLGWASYADMVAGLITSLDLHSALLVALANGATLCELGFKEPLFAALRKRFGPRAPRLEATMITQLRFSRIMALRRRGKSPGLQFFLALLLNAVDRREITAQIEQRFPDRPPGELVIGWIQEVSRLAGTPVLSVGELDLVRELLRPGAPPADLPSGMAGSSGHGSIARDRIVAGQGSLLEPLLR